VIVCRGFVVDESPDFHSFLFLGQMREKQAVWRRNHNRECVPEIDLARHDAEPHPERRPERDVRQLLDDRVRPQVAMRVLRDRCAHEQPDDRVLTDIEVPELTADKSRIESQEKLHRIKAFLVPRVVLTTVQDFENVRYEIRLHLGSALV